MPYVSTYEAQRHRSKPSLMPVLSVLSSSSSTVVCSSMKESKRDLDPQISFLIIRLSPIGCIRASLTYCAYSQVLAFERVQSQGGGKPHRTTGPSTLTWGRAFFERRARRRGVPLITSHWAATQARHTSPSSKALPRSLSALRPANRRHISGPSLAKLPSVGVASAPYLPHFESECRRGLSQERRQSVLLWVVQD